jgi:hypothetical protein
MRPNKLLLAILLVVAVAPTVKSHVFAYAITIGALDPDA